MMSKQRGSTLLIALVMLVLLTLIALSSMNATTTSIQVVGNAQFREEANAAAQQAVEGVISNSNFKDTPPPAQTINIGGSNYTVTFDPPPRCVSYQPVQAGQAGVPNICFGSIGDICFWTVWDVTAVAVDASGSGATSTVHQGVRTIAGLNTALEQCGI